MSPRALWSVSGFPREHRRERQEVVRLSWIGRGLLLALVDSNVSFLIYHLCHHLCRPSLLLWLSSLVVS